MSSLDLLSKYLLIMELPFDVTLYSNLCNENSNAGHVKCSHRPHLACGLQVPHPCFGIVHFAMACFVWQCIGAMCSFFLMLSFFTWSWIKNGCDHMVVWSNNISNFYIQCGLLQNDLGCQWVCYECVLLWTWSVTNWSVMKRSVTNVVWTSSGLLWTGLF